MIDILIPVLNRPQRAEPLVQNIKDTTTLAHRILFLCSKGDTREIKACIDTGEDVCIMPFAAAVGDFAKKINTGYRNTEGEFLLVGADDLLFHSGWDIPLIETAQRTNAGVIGTNDLHNPRVKRGQLSTHPLVRRSYIEEWGGTYDGSGAVFCEVYDHQYVDDELVQTAMARGQWVFVEDSHVEHLHPYFGLREEDETYRKAFRHARQDFRLFQRRLRDMKRAVRVELRKRRNK